MTRRRALLGRHERASANAGERRGIRSVAARAAGKRPSAYRLTAFADCLLYPVGRDPYALELCFDRAGHLAEAIDRRRGKPKIASLREHPEASTIRAPRSEVVRLLERLGAPEPRGGWR